MQKNLLREGGREAFWAAGKAHGKILKLEFDTKPVVIKTPRVDLTLEWVLNAGKVPEMNLGFYNGVTSGSGCQQCSPTRFGKITHCLGQPEETGNSGTEAHLPDSSL